MLEQGYSRSEAAISLEVGINALSRWVKEFEKKDKHAFVGKGSLSVEQVETRKLKARIKRLEMERDNIVGRMSRKGNCWDNAVAESFFGSLKQERVQWNTYRNRHEARQDVVQYITMFYNSFRLHSTLGYICSNAFEDNLKRLN